ncbi:MAG: Rho termination factor N-terminal domain-containing protein, partial [Synechococcaceae cyanobacterium ELA182]
MTQKPLSSLATQTLRQLRQIASDLGVTLYSRKSKEELVDAISTHHDEGGPTLTLIEAEMAPASRPAAETRVVFLPRDPQWAYV